MITGASGLLGTWLLRQVPSAVDLVAVRHTTTVDRQPCVRVDLRDPAATKAAVESVSPDVVIHAAYRRDRASVVDATRNVARVARQVRTRLVAISTDAVFAGDGRPRCEQDTPDPIWDHGRWKVDEAEQALLALGCHAAVVRLPLLVSVDPPDQTVRKVLRAVDQNESIGWYDGERRQPAWAAEVAAALWRLALLDPDAATGLWHLPGPERLPRGEIGARTAAELGVECPGLAVPAPPSSQRPHDLCLTGQRAHGELSWHPSPVLAAVGPP